VRDSELLKWIGAIRTSPYSGVSERLALADRLGILVPTGAVAKMAEYATDVALHLQALQEQMRRDYNYACMVACCVANAHSRKPAAVRYITTKCCQCLLGVT